MTRDEQLSDEEIENWLGIMGHVPFVQWALYSSARGMTSPVRIVSAMESRIHALKDEIKTLRLELAAAENNESFVAEERKKNERLREALKDARRLADGCSQPDDCIRAIAAVSRAALASTGSEPDEHRFEPTIRDAPSTAATSWDYSRCNVCKRPITDGIHVTASTGSEE